MTRKTPRHGTGWSLTTMAWVPTEWSWALPISVRRSRRLTLRPLGRACSITTPCSRWAAGCARIDTTTTRAAILSPTSNLIFSSRPLARLARLTNAGGRAEVSYAKGINNLKAGVVFQHTFLTEDDSFGVVDPTANAPCLNADGSPYTNPGLTDPANCTGPLQAESGFHTHPGLLRLDSNGVTAGLRRLPEYNQRPVPL